MLGVVNSCATEKYFIWDLNFCIECNRHLARWCNIMSLYCMGIFVVVASLEIIFN